MYNVDMTKPFPYRDNYRSTTLLAYLNDVPPGGGGETEFMMATPRPFMMAGRRGVGVGKLRTGERPDDRHEAPGGCVG